MATTVSQSQHLIDIGIPVESADMFWGYINPWSRSDSSFDGGYKNYPLPKKMWVSKDEYSYQLPAWYLEALLKLIPYNVTNNNAVYRFKLVKYPDKWECYHENFGLSSTGIQEGKTALEAAYNMVVYLKENKFI